MKISILFLFFGLLFSACSDSASVNFFDKNVKNEEIECLKLVVFPPDKSLEESFQKLYGFKRNCNYKLEVSKKSGISCNSNQNAQKKARGFPSSYLKMQISRDKQLVYSYYIDLMKDVTEEDIQKAFSRLNEDLKIK